MNNKVIIAAAGSGKTNHLVEEALEIKDEKVLITTFTITAEKEIRDRIFKEKKCLPENITVQTWFSVILQHGVRPYQNYLFNEDIRGMARFEERCSFYTKGSDIRHYYFNKNRKIYADKILQFALGCNQVSGGKVIDRLSKIYAHLFIDEVQDLAAYDLPFLILLFDSSINTLLVGDPRQGTYSTSNARKNKKYSKSGIAAFFDEIPNIEIDRETYRTNHRSIPALCDFSNKLYPDYTKTQSGNANTSEHDGIFLVRKNDVAEYLLKYKPTQLGYSKGKSINDNFEYMNFGQSKGLSRDRVLIYPTEGIKEWLKNNTPLDSAITHSKLYVAITRARYSVAFVYDYKDGETIAGITNYPAP